MKTIIRVLAFAAGLTLSFAHAHAQGTARSQDFDLSIRSAAMGGASTGVAWGAVGVWGNPASLSSVQGIEWAYTRTRLVPGLADDVYLTSKHLRLGGAGIGVSLSGQPFEGLGETRLDYGTSSPFVDEERIRSWAIGVSPLQVMRALGRLPGSSVLARADLAIGIQSKDTRVSLGPVSAEATGIDAGISARMPLLPEESRRSLEVGLGYAVLGANKQLFDFGFGLEPGTRTHRFGVATRLVLKEAFPAGVTSLNPIIGVDRTLAFTLALDRASFGRLGEVDYNVNNLGFEATLLGILSARIGYYDDQVGQLTDPTYGAGLHVPVGGVMALDFDYANIPQAHDSGLPNVDRIGVNITLDPMALAKRLK